MATKNYMINDKWLDIDKENIVELQSVDGEIGSVKVNGEDYGGGGGSSDFSTAEVTIAWDGQNDLLKINEPKDQVMAIINDGKIPKFTMSQAIIDEVNQRWQNHLTAGDYYMSVYSDWEDNQTYSLYFYTSIPGSDSNGVTMDNFVDSTGDSNVFGFKLMQP